VIINPSDKVRDQRGAAAVELTLLVPALLLVLGLLVEASCAAYPGPYAFCT